MRKQSIYRLIMLFTLFVLGIINMDAQESINMHHAGSNGNHSEHYTPADAPEVYFDSDEMEIIIEAEGFAGYYTVEVRFMSSGDPVIHTQIDGYGDTIDVSSLTAGYYQLVITSEYGTYQGDFSIR